MIKKAELRKVLNGPTNYVKTFKQLYHMHDRDLELSNIPESVSTYISELPTKDNSMTVSSSNCSSKIAIAFLSFILLCLIMIRLVNFFTLSEEDIILSNFNETSLKLTN